MSALGIVVLGVWGVALAAYGWALWRGPRRRGPGSVRTAAPLTPLRGGRVRRPRERARRRG